MPDDIADVSVASQKSGFGLTVDWWAVLLAFVLAALVKLGLLQHIGW